MTNKEREKILLEYQGKILRGEIEPLSRYPDLQQKIKDFRRKIARRKAKKRKLP